MTVLKETLDRDAVAIQAVERTRFGHDPLESPGFHWGEMLDDAWGAEFDRRLAAWEAELPSLIPTDLGTLASASLPR